MEGFRLLENGDLRVSESGVLRSTEGFNDADVLLDAIGSISPSGERFTYGALDASGVATLSAIPTVTKRPSVSLDSTATLEATGTSFQNAYSSLIGVGSQEVSGSAVRAATSDLQGSSVLSPTGSRIKYGLGNFQGTGTTEASGSRIRYGLYAGIADEAIRVIESGDIRVTENGNTRLTYPLAYNVGEGTLVAEPVFTRFNSLAYVKKDGVWYRMTPNTKHEGAWKVPTRSYKNINGNWKRIY